MPSTCTMDSSSLNSFLYTCIIDVYHQPNLIHFTALHVCHRASFHFWSFIVSLSVCNRNMPPPQLRLFQVYIRVPSIYATISIWFIPFSYTSAIDICPCLKFNFFFFASVPSTYSLLYCMPPLPPVALLKDSTADNPEVLRNNHSHTEGMRVAETSEPMARTATPHRYELSFGSRQGDIEATKRMDASVGYASMGWNDGDIDFEGVTLGRVRKGCLISVVLTRVLTNSRRKF